MAKGTFSKAVKAKANGKLTVEDSKRRDKQAGLPRDKRRADTLKKRLDKKWCPKIEPEFVGEALDALAEALQGKMPINKELATYRKYIPSFMVEFFDQGELILSLLESVDEVDSGMAKRNRKRWTEEEDEQLIEMAANGSSMTLMGFALDRTPTAVQTRISYLVGIEKLSVDVAGKFIGWLDGELVEGDIDGTVSKRKS
ncbi:MAG: hypothetical protein ACSW8D_08210 [Prevotella sp.]